jgi:small-conductance mechanosensitive channel
MDNFLSVIDSWLEKPLFTFAGQVFTLGEVLLLPVMLALAWIGYRIIVRIVVGRLRKLETSPDVIHLIERVMLVIFLLLLLLTLLDYLEVPIAAFAFLSGAIAIGVGFGAQNVINNFISGWILMWERPIRIGDFLEIGTASGTVESINTRSTRIRRVDGVHMLIPNSHLLENQVVNWTLIDRLVRTEVRVGVAYGSPVEKVREILERLVDENKDVLKEPKSIVLFNDFGDSSLVFDVVFWVNAGSERDLRVVRSDLRYAIDREFAVNHIVIAFPQRDVHLNTVGPIDVRVVDTEK